MKLQFSLATLLACMTVLAVVAGVCEMVPVKNPDYGIVPSVGSKFPYMWIEPEIERKPTTNDFVNRFALWGPATVLFTLAALWLICRQKSPNRPPVG